MGYEHEMPLAQTLRVVLRMLVEQVSAVDEFVLAGE